MPDIANSTRARRLEAADYRHVSGWVPKGFAARVEAQIEAFADDVERIAAEARPKGAPRKADRIAATPGRRGRPKESE